MGRLTGLPFFKLKKEKMANSKKFEFEEIKAKMNKRVVLQEIEITPTLAKYLLDLNTQNRPVNDQFVRQYAYDMEKSRWMFTGDTLKLTRSGRLIDGQKRLMAVELSKTKQTFNLQLGLDDDVF